MRLSRRHLILLVPAASITLALTACSGGTDAASGSATGSGAAGKKVVYIASSGGFYAQVTCGARQVAEKQGINFSFQYAKEFSAASQTPLLNAAVSSRPDAIIISATDTKALNVPLKQAAAQGIKIITAANGVNGGDFVTSAVQGDNEASGQKTAELLGKLIAGKTGKIGYLGYTPGGSAITDARQKGFEEELKKYPNLELIEPTILSTTDAASGAAATNALLSANRDLVGIVGSYLDVAAGMATALRERGLSGKVIALQMDADPTAMDNLENQSLQGLTAEPTRQEGVQAMTQAVNALTGKPVERTVSVAPVVITRDNASASEVQQAVAKETC